MERQTFKDGLDTAEVHAQRRTYHGQCEREQLIYYPSGIGFRQLCVAMNQDASAPSPFPSDSKSERNRLKAQTYLGTGAEVSDGSGAEAVGAFSLSRWRASFAPARRVAMIRGRLVVG